jgi:hypothetical protein
LIGIKEREKEYNRVNIKKKDKEDRVVDYFKSTSSIANRK